MFTAEDMERVAETVVEIGAGKTKEKSLEWLRAREIDISAMELVCASALTGFLRKILRDGNVEGAVVDVVGQTFRLGWEAALSTREPTL